MNKIIIANLLIITPLLVSGCTANNKNTTPRIISFDNTDSDIVKVMTFNVRVNTIIDGFNKWNYRKPIVFDTIAANKTDVFCLQEAKQSQVLQIQCSLPQYACYAVGRKNGKSKGESCAIFYRKDRFTLMDSGSFWFSDTPSIPGSKSWGNLFPRLCSWILLTEKRTGIGFYVYNVHLDNFSQNSREKSVNLLCNKITQRKTQYPSIVMGDFNMERDNPAMGRLLRYDYSKSSVYVYDILSLIHQAPKTNGTRHSFTGKTNGPQIDHICTSGKTQVLDISIDHYNRDGRYPSDHFPVTATIRLGAQEFANRNSTTGKLGIW